MKAKYLLIALVIAGMICGIVGYTLYAPSGTVPTPTPTSELTPVQMISFERAVECALRGGEARWKFSEYRWLGEFEGEPFVTLDGLVAGHLEWRANNGTLYEAEYPSGKDRGEIERFTGVEDTEEYYVWNIILMDGSSRHIDARNGELLSISPSRVPCVLTFETAVRVVYAPQKRIEEWKVQEYKRIGDFESEPFETLDGLVKGHLLWRASNGTLYEVWLPHTRYTIGKVLYIEVPDDREEYNVWEITTENNVYYIDARNGIIRLIKEETPLPPPIKLIPAYTLDITFPSMPVTVRKGESVTLPVAIKSLVNEPIRIRLALVSMPDREAPLPEFITYEVEGYVTVNPHETVHTQMIIKVSEDAQLGEYSFELHGELEKPVKERGGEGYIFSLVVVS